MIIRKHKCIFIHVEKTGGTSIECTLDPNLMNESATHKANANAQFEDKHWTALEYLQKHPKLYKEYFTFAFVRNPWDRLVSRYEWQILIGNPYLIKLDFKEYIKSSRFQGLKFSYLDKICDNQNKIIVDFVGRFETLQRDFNIVCDRIGLKHTQLPYVNKISRKHYTEYYDEETKQIVAEKFAKDIEYFRYEFVN
jgi:chondroitin 4-sulfotransferase 11